MGHDTYPTLLYLSADSKMFGPITYLTAVYVALVYLNLAYEITHSNTRRRHDQSYYLHRKLHIFPLNLGLCDEKRVSKYVSCVVVFIIVFVIFLRNKCDMIMNYRLLF